MTDPNNPYGQPGQQPDGQPQNPGQPYGQQPGGQPQNPSQPYGQQGGFDPNQQPAYGQQPSDPNQPQFGSAAPGGSPFPNQPAQPSGFAKFMKSVGGRVLGVLVVVLIAVGVYFFNKSDAASSAVGDCLNITGSGTDLKSDKLDCGDPTATYKVVVTGESVSCEDGEIEYTEGKNTKLCMSLNVAVGDCVTIGSGLTNPDAKVACSDKIGDPDTYKVLLVDPNSADESMCPAEATNYSAPTTRLNLICLGANE